MSDWPPIPHATPIDASGLIPKHIKTREQLNIVEATNVHKATIKYLASRPTRRQAPFTLKWIYRLHKEMFGQVWSWAGSPRRFDLNLGIPHAQIETALQQLLDDVAYWRNKTTTPIIEQAAMLHHRAVHIHPFPNGNGRWSRLLTNIHLKQMRHPLTVWPADLIGPASTIRGQYIEAIKSADKGDLKPLIELHERHSEQKG